MMAASLPKSFCVSVVNNVLVVKEHFCISNFFFKFPRWSYLLPSRFRWQRSWTKRILKSCIMSYSDVSPFFYFSSCRISYAIFHSVHDKSLLPRGLNFLFGLFPLIFLSSFLLHNFSYFLAFPLISSMFSENFS